MAFDTGIIRVVSYAIVCKKIHLMPSFLIPTVNVFFLLTLIALAALALALIACIRQRTSRSVFNLHACTNTTHQHPLSLSRKEAFWVVDNWLSVRNDHDHQLRGQAFYQLIPSLPRQLPYYAVRLYSLLTHVHDDASQLHQPYIDDRTYSIKMRRTKDEFPIRQSKGTFLGERAHRYFCPKTAKSLFKQLTPAQQGI